MLAGVALVGATAIAITPIAPSTVQLPALHSLSPAVSLSAFGFDNPVTAVLGTLDLVNTNFWDTESTDILPNSLDLYQGMVPQFIYDHLPILSQLGYNGSDFIGSSVYNLLTGPDSSLAVLSDAAWGLPDALLYATQQALAGNIPGALATLTAAIITPIQAAGTTALNAGAYVFNGVLTNLSNVIATIPNLVGGLANTTIGAVQLVLGKAIQVGTAILTAAASLDAQGVWNAGVEGLLGPTGLPGLVEQLTIGGGVQVPVPTDPTNEEPPTTVYQPSFRVWANNAVYEVANALGGNFPTIDLTTNPIIASAAPLATAAPALSSDAPEVQATSEDVSAGGASSADASPVKPAPLVKSASSAKPAATPTGGSSAKSAAAAGSEDNSSASVGKTNSGSSAKSGPKTTGGSSAKSSAKAVHAAN
ncbi:hypothetical protein [Mycolicibacterium komossense]|uniref:PE-PGRS family protein n=1 Tax=Mycolicibacterium komossense TaxID=1779 RepID=A0ABT3CE52_9MYCO|nr:hypothetical protein [Mycolicibacterium komossense]MCV7227506.1 hypothetical protein [Mycolicibacterium komossense]